jgi:hypothetical protein
MKKWVWLAVVIITSAIVALVLTGTDKERTVRSRILEERRSLLIHLPPGYRESTASYPVLYLLDAYDQLSSSGPSFYTIAKRVDAMSLQGIPPMVIIGVTNTHRNRDMLPVKTGLYPEGGGADRFLAFLTEEAVPYVDESFRTTGERILYGRSDSGLFTVYALLESPETFSAYIASSPTVGHCPTLLRLKTDEMFRENPNLENALFIIYGDDDIAYAKNFIPALTRIIRNQATEGFRFGMNVVPGEAHIPSSSLYDGLRFYFSPQ